MKRKKPKSKETKPKTKKKNNNQYVKSVEQLHELIDQGHNEFAILLNGPCFSRKTIEYNRKSHKFIVFNHIDDTDQKLTVEELMNDNITNIGKAIRLSALVAIIP